jgi:hypothetical protein
LCSRPRAGRDGSSHSYNRYTIEARCAHGPAKWAYRSSAGNRVPVVLNVTNRLELELRVVHNSAHGH